MKSKEYSDLFESVGYLVDEATRIGEIVDDIDTTKEEEYRELRKKIDNLSAEAEAIKNEMQLLD